MEEFAQPQPAVQWLWIARYGYQPNDELLNHHHDFFQLIHVIQGALLLHQQPDRNPVHIEPGTTLLFPPGKSHGWKVGKDSCDTLDLKFQVNDPDLGEAIRQLPFSMTHTHQHLPDLLKMLQLASEASSWQKRLLERSLESFLISLLHEAAPHFQIPPPLQSTDPVCESLLEVILTHMEDWPDQQEIARLTGYSYRHLSARSKLAWQRTPVAVLQYCRVIKACELLIQTEFTVLQVAQQVGFQTEQHLSRHFKSLLGQSPGRWRGSLSPREVLLDKDYQNQLYLKP